MIINACGRYQVSGVALCLLGGAESGSSHRWEQRFTQAHELCPVPEVITEIRKPRYHTAMSGDPLSPQE